MNSAHVTLCGPCVANLLSNQSHFVNVMATIDDDDVCMVASHNNTFRYHSHLSAYALSLGSCMKSSQNYHSSQTA
jgi:hypothetical protein